ncbi:hypothetical protein AKJ65_04600 [candidate division MSBL1 archaeon SCGC-AAA259E19]|uniref:acetate--CoA ligase (ADP-forming) n=2 Tax=candidate division MSBL1 TaxID=215777 RepID=A0A133V4B5_9EURY|nr:hypothetical protein AKJ65_04600 [candidate division MSBL1 archaeon SCGC-AAA259E19]KXB01284.1 hypothetical protein AKJ41_02150 [candidate division MSBL1 archaeon SCGC-AAA259O05]
MENLDKFFSPSSVAVIGATDEEGSIGRTITTNLMENYEGEFFPINPNRKEVRGIETFLSVENTSEDIDLAVVVTPRQTVPQIIEECGKAEIPAVIIVTAGFGESDSKGKKLEREIGRKRAKYGIRVLGPNSMGIVRPSNGFNTTLWKETPARGRTAFISQSGALGPSIFNLQARTGTGLSSFVSVGNVLDVDFGDLINYFGRDPETETILMYVESIRNPGKFLSAAKDFTKTMPIILHKAGRSSGSSEAISSHVGLTPGDDSLYSALFRRSGSVRVNDIGDLFSCSEALARKCLPKGPNLAIITNAGGPGVTATDTLLNRNGKMATFSNVTKEKLKEGLEPYMSISNPIDISSDADVNDYLCSVEACLGDEGVDGILVIYTPLSEFSPNRLAERLTSVCEGTSKPILASWMGKEDTQAIDILRRGGIPVMRTPEQAVKIFMYMYGYYRNRELLYETPKSLSADKITPQDQLSQRNYLKAMMKRVTREGREALTEMESKNFLETYGIPAITAYVAKTPDKATELAEEIGFPVILKVHSPDILQKSKSGLVATGLRSDEEVEEAFRKIMERTEIKHPRAEIRGISVQSMIENINCELFLGSKKDSRFGSVVLFGRKEIGKSPYQNISVGFPPLNRTHAQRLIERAEVPELLEGNADRSSEKLRSLQEYLSRLSQLIIDHAEIKRLNADLAVTEKGFFVIDSSISLDKDSVSEEGEPHKHLIIRPYPLKYIKKDQLNDGRKITIRPIKPEDEPLIFDLFDSLSKETWRRRFFGPMKETTHEDMIRFAHVDYGREIAFVGELHEDGERKIAGMGRLIKERETSGEVALVVGDLWQGLGLGTKLLEYLIQFAKEEQLKQIWAILQRSNVRMIHLCRKFGFQIEEMNPKSMKMVLTLKP